MPPKTLSMVLRYLQDKAQTAEQRLLGPLLSDSYPLA